MKRLNQITGLVVLALACWMGWEALQLRYYTSLGPGPGFFGVWLAGIAGLLALGVLVSAARAPAEPLPEHFWPAPDGALRILGVVVGLVLVAFLLERVGYVIVSFCFLAAVMYVMGERRLWVNLPVAIVGSVGVYYLFVHLLQTRLPRGILGI